jgi:DHA1 family tetracycline resistance protein-like MFS transporter
MAASRVRPGGALSFILITAFLNQAGVGILNPLYPFIVSDYVAQKDAAFAIALIYTTFSLFQFIAVPTLGALSDRYGRRPVLLISLLGSAAGYLIFGIGGALWVLFLGRLIDGVTGGNLAAIYAYTADITAPAERTKTFGLVGAVAGLGFVIGPAVGGAIYSLTGTLGAPLYAAAAVTLANTLWGYFVMPESLSVEKRDPRISLARLNPFSQLRYVLAKPQLRLLLGGVLMWMLAFAMLQSNLSYLTEDRLGWTPDGTSVIFFTIGLVGILTQGVLVRRLLPIIGESKMAIAGLGSMLTGFLVIAFVSATGIAPVLFIAVIFTAMGNGLITPSLNGLLSQAVSVREQGRVQGGSQSVQALGRVVGPLWSGWTYERIGRATPYLSGAVELGLAVLAVVAAAPILAAHQAETDEVSQLEPETDAIS